MKRMPKKVATSLTAFLFMAGFLGLGNYTVKVNKDLTVLPKSPPIADTANSPLQAGQPQSEFQQPEASAQQTPDQENGTCVSVYDGDTITVRLDKSPQELTKVRLIGLDTPELKAGEFGSTARDFTRSMVLGQELTLEYDSERYDKYDRSLAYAYLKDGTFVNATLLEEGYARVMTIPPNTAHAAEFKALEVKAQRKYIGIWSQPPPKCTWRDEKVVKEWTF